MDPVAAYHELLEDDAEWPAGIAYADHLAEVFGSLPVMRAFRKRFRLRKLPVQGRQVSVMLRAFREWGREVKPTVAIVDWKGLPTVSEFEMFRDRFAAEGVKAVICDPVELEYRPRTRRLHANGTPVNLVYRRVLTSE